MRLNISYEFGSITPRQISEFVKVFSKSKLKGIEVEKYPNILTENPILKKNSVRVENFKKMSVFMEYIQKTTYNDRIEFIFENIEDSFVILKNTHIVVSDTDRNEREIVKIFKDLLYNENMNGLAYFNPFDTLCSSLGLGFGFRPLQTYKNSYYPGNILILHQNIIQRIGVELIDIFNAKKEGQFYSIKFSNDSNDITKEISVTGFRSFFGKKKKYDYSSCFDKQKLFVNKLIDSGVLKSDNEECEKLGVLGFGEKILPKKELFSYYWLDENGGIVPKEKSTNFFYIKSRSGSSLETKLLSVFEGEKMLTGL